MQCVLFVPRVLIHLLLVPYMKLLHAKCQILSKHHYTVTALPSLAMTIKQLLELVQLGDWFTTIDLKYGYFHYVNNLIVMAGSKEWFMFHFTPVQAVICDQLEEEQPLPSPMGGVFGGCARLLLVALDHWLALWHSEMTHMLVNQPWMSPSFRGRVPIAFLPIL